jgi:hypothetical protein
MELERKPEMKRRCRPERKITRKKEKEKKN